MIGLVAITAKRELGHSNYERNSTWQAHKGVTIVAITSDNKIIVAGDDYGDLRIYKLKLSANNPIN